MDLGGQLAANPARLDSLVYDQAPPRLVDTLDYGLDIVRCDRAQVDELNAEMTEVFGDEALDVLCGVLEKVKSAFDGVERRAVRDDGEVAAFLQDFGGGKWELEVARRDLLDGRAVEDLGLEEELCRATRRQ